LRIISGIAKGRKLITPPEHSTSIRPTSDRAREALFNILGRHVYQANVLDLFAGTGAVGLEAFSRSAKNVIFVENDDLALKILKKNILLCHKGYSGNCEIRVVKHDLSQRLPPGKMLKQSVSKYDLIFADPPYAKDLSIKTLDLINKSGFLSKSGLVIIEERFNIELPASLSNIILADKRRYGKTTFWFYRST